MVLLTPLTLALSPLERGDFPSQKKGNNLKLTPMATALARPRAEILPALARTRA